MFSHHSTKYTDKPLLNGFYHFCGVCMWGGGGFMYLIVHRKFLFFLKDIGK